MKIKCLFVVLVALCLCEAQVVFSQTIKVCTVKEVRKDGRKNGSRRPDLANIPAKKWANGQTLRVRFLDGDDYVRGKVMQYAPVWSQFANIRFQFVAAGDAEIRVSFVQGAGSWSYIGKDSINSNVPQSVASMNFGWFNAATEETEFSRTILHEFGHALGMIHEHQSPAAGIPWNRPAVYYYYYTTMGWDSATVDEQIFRQYEQSQTNFSQYDRLSIMHYPIPAALLTDPAFAVGWNTNLSASDAAFVSIVYPFPVPEDQYLVGDWDGDGRDNLAVRRGNLILMDFNFDGEHDQAQFYGNGNSEDQYLVGDWNGDGRDNIAVRRGHVILMDYNFDGVHDQVQYYGLGNSEDQYLVGDWDGDGRDNVAVRRGHVVLMDYNFDGVGDQIQYYGLGSGEDQYLAGDWNGDGRDNLAVRRGHVVLMDFNFDGVADFAQGYGNGNSENQYLVGDWNGDGRANLAVRRGHVILMDYNFDGAQDQVQYYGHGT